MGSWLLAPLGLVVTVALCGCASAADSGRQAKHRVEHPAKHAVRHPVQHRVRHSVQHAVKPATLAELRWIGRLDSQYEHDQNFADSCEISHHAGLGKPPTPRLWRYVATAAKACKDYDRGTSEAGSPEAAQKSLDESVTLMDRANQALDRLRPALQPLPRIDRASARSRIAIRYTRVAGAIGGNRRVLVRCWSLSDWNQVTRRVSAYWGSRVLVDLLGFVIEPHFISLGPTACRSLDEFTYEHARPHNRASLDQIAVGLNALAHESEHIRNPYRSEAVVECYALQSISDASKLLGGTRRYGELVARDYLRDLYAEQPPNYRTAACRNGGPLDEHRGRAAWP